MHGHIVMNIQRFFDGLIIFLPLFLGTEIIAHIDIEDHMCHKQISNVSFDALSLLAPAKADQSSKESTTPIWILMQKQHRAGLVWTLLIIVRISNVKVSLTKIITVKGMPQIYLKARNMLGSRLSQHDVSAHFFLLSIWKLVVGKVTWRKE